MSEREKYPGDEWRQIYNGWREYPLGMKHTLLLGILIGWVLGGVVFIWVVK
jgi:hypothetical protein